MPEQPRSRVFLWVLLGGGAFFLFLLAVFSLVYFTVRTQQRDSFAGFGNKIAVVDLEGVILSPKEMPLESLVPASARKPLPNTLIPRCRSEAVALACTDDRAGPAPLDTATSPLRQSKLRARELKIDSGSSGASIQPAERNIGVIVYEFRLAHR